VLTVTRAADLTGTSTVNYGTSNGTALSGVNYTTTSGTLTFVPDDVTKTITVPILNDGVQDTNLLFLVTLSSPSAGTVIVNAVGTVVIQPILFGSPSSVPIVIPDPRNMEFEAWSTWTAFLTQTVNVAPMVDEETWQIWAERFINATNLRKYNMPNPYQYQDWHDWAFQMMLSVNHG
jgi:hypothetical protein